MREKFIDFLLDNTNNSYLQQLNTEGTRLFYVLKNTENVVYVRIITEQGYKNLAHFNVYNIGVMGSAALLEVLLNSVKG